MWIHNDVEIKRANEPKYRVLWHFFKGGSNTTTPLPPYPPVLSRASAAPPTFRINPLPPSPTISIPVKFSARSALRWIFSVDESKLNLCSVGRICHQKAYDLLMTYLAEVKKTARIFIFI